jgi:hypothetical protein
MTYPGEPGIDHKEERPYESDYRQVLLPFPPRRNTRSRFRHGRVLEKHPPYLFNALSSFASTSL